MARSEDPVAQWTRKRLEELKAALEGNNFEAYIAADATAARELVLGTILPNTGAKTICWGGSKTLIATGLPEALKAMDGLTVMDPYVAGLSPEEKVELRRQGMLSDLFLCGANAVTEGGALVNLDMTGNRVASLTFGPRHVVVLVSASKITADLDDAMYRIKNFAAPVNAARLKMKTPCAKTSRCADCASKDRICNVWTIHEKCFPKGRIKVVLIEERLGF